MHGRLRCFLRFGLFPMWLATFVTTFVATFKALTVTIIAALSMTIIALKRRTIATPNGVSRITTTRFNRWLSAAFPRSTTWARGIIALREFFVWHGRSIAKVFSCGSQEVGGLTGFIFFAPWLPSSPCQERQESDCAIMLLSHHRRHERT
jgi:hypothetical protein